MDTLQQLPTHGDGLLDIRELARTLLETMVNEIMDAQADMACEDEATARNGYRERGLATPVGDIVLRIPRLRAGTYFPEGLIERCSRADRAVAAAVAESWANGVSTRKMERIAQKMGIGRLSKDQVSAMCRSLDAGVAEPASRDLGEVGSATCSWTPRTSSAGGDGRVQSTAVVTAIGVGSDGVRRMLGVAAIDTEAHAGWLGFLRGLRERGLSGVRLVVSDAHAGLVRAIAECLPGAGWQRCVVHLERDVCSLLASRRHRALAGKALQAVFRETDPATVRSAYRAAIDAVGAMSARFSRRPRPTSSPTWTSPWSHRRRIRTNNVQERMNREIKRRSRVVQVFPSVNSVLRLVGTVCAEQDEDWSSRRYISPESMRRLSEPAEPEPAESEGSRWRGLMVVETAMELAGGGRRAA